MISLTLAAGYATRMYPLTNDFPKPLLPIGETTILGRLLGDVDGLAGIDRHVVVTNARFEARFRDWAAGCKLRRPIDIISDGTLDNDHRLGAVCDIQLVVESLGLDDDLLVMAGDNVLDFSLGALSDAFHASGTTTIMCYEEQDDARLHKCGIAQLSTDMRVLSFEEKPASPRSHWATPPFYLYARCDVPLIKTAIKSGCTVDAPGSLVAALCGRTKVRAIVMPGRRYDVGDIAGYERVRALCV